MVMESLGLRRLALVTGASSATGLELAGQFAAQGFDLVMVADDAGLVPAAVSITDFGVGVEPVRADPRTQAGAEALWSRVEALARPLAAAALLDLDGTTHLADLVVRHMAAHGEGRVLFASSAPGASDLRFFESPSSIRSQGGGRFVPDGANALLRGLAEPGGGA